MKWIFKYYQATIFISLFLTSKFNCLAQTKAEDLENVNEAFVSLINYFFNDTTYRLTGSLLPTPGQIDTTKIKKKIQIQFILHPNSETDQIIGKENQYFTLSNNDFLNSINSLLKQGKIETVSEIKNVYESLGTLYIEGVYCKNKTLNNKIYFDIVRTAAVHKKSQRGEIYLLVKESGKWVVKKHFTTFMS